jgi:hypothetical protein
LSRPPGSGKSPYLCLALVHGRARTPRAPPPESPFLRRFPFPQWASCPAHRSLQEEVSLLKQEPPIRRTLGVVSRFSFRCISRESIAVPNDGRYFCSSCRKALGSISWCDQGRAPLFTELPRGGLLGNSGGTKRARAVRPRPTAASVTVGREDLHPARNNIHLLVDAFPPGQPYLEGNRRETSRRKEQR